VNKKIIIIGGTAKSLINFRGELVTGFVESGVDVLAMTGDANEEVERVIREEGASYKPFSLRRNGLNPLADLRTVTSLFSALRRESDDTYVLAYTIKPVIWGGVVTRLLGLERFTALITGLGFAFQGGSVKRNILLSLVKTLYRIALKGSNAVIFQNPDNLETFVSLNIVARDKCYLVNGSGVNLESFEYKEQKKSKKTVFLLIARLLGEKGIREYMHAAEIVREQFPESEFVLLGPEDTSPDRIPLEEVMACHNRGAIVYKGAADDVRPYIEGANIFVLPSYHEGLPRTVIEAMAVGRPVLTTDVPGCRETVMDGVNGFLVPSANVAALVERMVWFIENQLRWQDMGRASRQIAEERFDVHCVNSEIMKIMGIHEE